MPKLVKCEIAKNKEQFFHCLCCSAHLKDVPETEEGTGEVVFLCPKCHHFFNERGVISFDEADEMFPGASNISY